MTDTEVMPTFANTGELIHHDHGCRCWPHVSERDALDAIAATGLNEYRDGKRAAALVPDSLDAQSVALLAACQAKGITSPFDLAIALREGREP